MFLITQGYGPESGVTATASGTIPEYSSTGDTFTITADLAKNPPISILFDQEITGLNKSNSQQ